MKMKKKATLSHKLKVVVYAISKNEEKFVDRWVKSMNEADEIYVLDTGSEDNTVKKLKTISYDEMLEMSSMGAKVLHNRCVEIGKKYNIPIFILR